jgi:hypothetical protein
MDASKIELRAWLPWATTACLAALVACLGELWIIERMRARVLRDQAALTEAALKSAENQLEAERILDHGRWDRLRSRPGSPSAIHVALLAPPGPASAASGGPGSGAVVWGGAGDSGSVTLAPAPPAPAGRDYQLWFDGPEGVLDCGILDVASAQAPGGCPVRLPGAVGPSGRFVLILGARGGARSLAEAEAGGPIVLATPPGAGNISTDR